MVYLPTAKSIGNDTIPLLSVVLVYDLPFRLRVTVFFTKGTVPDVRATLNGVSAPLPNDVVLLTVNLEVLLGSLLPYYLMIGVIEGIINVVILEFISRTNNNILEIEKV
jgi:ABC-type Co2+ transport system permease subunit